jgi:hypothetical protein
MCFIKAKDLLFLLYAAKKSLNVYDLYCVVKPSVSKDLLEINFIQTGHYGFLYVPDEEHLNRCNK